MKKPNLFLIGAPKCGTTSMCEYLSRHPDVCFSVPKEPNYFCADITETFCSAETENEYLSKCFPTDFEECKIVGDGSASSLYSEIAVQSILEFNPNAKFIVMLRNPVELVYSLHSHLLFTQHEHIVSFQSAWRLQSVRRKGRSLPPGCQMPKILQYGAVGMLGEQMERLFYLVPREKIKIILFEDLKDHAVEVYRDVLDFLDLAHYNLDEFGIFNQGKRAKSVFLGRVINRIARWKDRLEIQRSFGLIGYLYRRNLMNEQRFPLSSEFRQELKLFFTSDIIRLSRLIDRNLSCWGGK